jgi:5-methylcytosine-specific restriction endonuclease McrA
MIYIGSKSFNSQKALEKYTKTLIYSNLNSSISMYGDLWDFFNNLFNRHYEREWFGVIKEIIFESNGKYYKPTIYCSRGVETISINLCISGRTPTYKDRLTKVMRALIEPEIINYRLDNPECCAYCGTDSDLQVDHIEPFCKIRDDFLAVFGEPKDDFRWGENNRLISPNYLFNNAWKSFHIKNSTFQMLCKKCNNKKSNSITQNENPSNC